MREEASLDQQTSIISSSKKRARAPRLLLVAGFVLWIVTAFLLPPVAWLDRLSLAAWATTLLRLLGAMLVGAAVSKFWYSIVP